MLSRRFFLSLGLLLLPALALHAEDKPVLVFENLGLKNNYRIIFEQWDEQNHFASGAVEISDNVEDKVHTRLPFSAEVKADPKDKKTEILTVRGTALLAFFPPANKKEAFTELTWKIKGRKTREAKLKASLWSYGESTWVLDSMDFDKSGK